MRLEQMNSSNLSSWMIQPCLPLHFLQKWKYFWHESGFRSQFKRVNSALYSTEMQLTCSHDPSLRPSGILQVSFIPVVNRGLFYYLWCIPKPCHPKASPRAVGHLYVSMSIVEDGLDLHPFSDCSWDICQHQSTERDWPKDWKCHHALSLSKKNLHQKWVISALRLLEKLQKGNSQSSWLSVTLIKGNQRTQYPCSHWEASFLLPH